MFVCLRFGLDEDFHIERETKAKRCSLCSLSSRSRNTSDEAKSWLYEIAIDAILNYYRNDIDLRPSEHGRVTELYPERIRPVWTRFCII